VQEPGGGERSPKRITIRHFVAHPIACSPSGTQYEVMCGAVRKLVPELFPSSGVSADEAERSLGKILVWVE
jgi:hypothetical protein